jgi:hypothetical protein
LPVSVIPQPCSRGLQTAGFVSGRCLPRLTFTPTFGPFNVVLPRLKSQICFLGVSAADCFPLATSHSLVPSAAEGPLATFFQRSLPASLPPNLSTFQPSNFPTFCTAPGIACRQSPPDLHDTPTQRLSSLGGRSFSSDIRARQPKFLHLAARSAIFCVDALTHPHRPLLDRRSRPRRHRRSRPGRETRSRSG